MAIKDSATVVSQDVLAPGIFSIVVKTKAADLAVPGQFVSIFCKDKSKLLPRPISICEIDKEAKTLRMVYRVAGKGTEEISSYKANDTIEILGPQGNGFPLEGEHPMVIGGGIGVPPMLQLAKQLDNVTAVMGYRDDATFLSEEFLDNADYYVATDDGSVGTHGTVVDAIIENELECDVMFACGPKPMLRALKEYATKNNIKLYISMEERMACGIGACLACVCKSTEIDHHSSVKNKRVCVDGPVFLAEEVDLS